VRYFRYELFEHIAFTDPSLPGNDLNEVFFNKRPDLIEVLAAEM
jgi:hypothetical protein